MAPAAGDRGEYVVTVSATDDGDGGIGAPLTSAHTFVVAVESANDPPVLSFVGNAVAVVGAPLTLSLRATDADQEPLDWSLSGLPDTATLDAGDVYGTATLTWVPAFANVGQHAVQVTVSDQGNGDPAGKQSDVRQFDVVVRTTNHAPQIQAEPAYVVAENESLEISLHASDVDGDVVTYRSENLPEGARLDQQDGVLRWTPRFDQAGRHEAIVILATDGHLTDSATFEIEVTDVNRPPELFPLPPQYGREGESLQFDLTAMDLDGDSPRFQVVSGLPAGASLDPRNGQIRWTPRYDQAGQYRMVVRAEDVAAFGASREVQLNVLDVNRPPQISVTDHSGQIGQPLTFTVFGSDPDPGVELTYSAMFLPQGASLNAATGEFDWTPGPAQTGEHAVAFSVSDGQATTSRAVAIDVAVDPAAPLVTLELTPRFAVFPGDTVLLHAIADSRSPITNLQLTVDGQSVELDDRGRASVRADQPGKVAIEATAVDADGLVGHVAEFLKVRDPSDQAAPRVSLDAALGSRRLADPTDVVLTVDDVNLDDWRLELAVADGERWVELASGDHSISAASVAMIDPHQLPNGFHRLRLMARDMAGRSTTTEVVVETQVDASLARYERSESDLTATLDGILLDLTRRYDSLAWMAEGDFGQGWTLANRDLRIQTNVPTTGREHLGVYHGFTVDTRIYLTTPSGARVGFTFDPQPVAAGSLTLYRPAWQSDTGVPYTLHSTEALLTKAGVRFYDQATGQPYDPANPHFQGVDYRLDDLDGNRWTLDSLGRVVRQIDSGGGILFFTDSGVTATNGASVQFVRDDHGRIARVLGPEGETIRYEYDGLGRLASVRSLETGKSTAYEYADPPDGRLVLAAEKDGTGESIGYENQVVTTPWKAHLGGVIDFVGQPHQGSWSAAEADRYGFALTAGELASTVTESVLLRVVLEAFGDGPQAAPPEIAGLAPLSNLNGANRQDTLFALPRAGMFELLVRGSDVTSAGDYELHLSIAGDVNLDGRVDGLDSALFDQSLGLSSGDPGYLLAADFDGNGFVEERDRQILIANFGFLANRAPVPAADSPAWLTHEDLAVVIPLDQAFTDPNGDRMFFQITEMTHGTARLTHDGRSALFTPLPGYTGPATLSVMADDGVLASPATTLEIHVSDAPLVELQIEQRQLRVDVDQVEAISVVGDFADQPGVALPVSYVTFSSSDPTIASVSDTGLVAGQVEGTAVLLVQRGPVAAATTITVGQPGDVEHLFLQRVGMEVYPDAFALALPGGSRQMLVSAGGDDVSAGDVGTHYVVGNSQIAQVTEDGLVQAVGVGVTTITVLRGPAEAVIPIRVVQPQTGPQVIDAEGGVVQGADGSLLAIGPGTLSEPATVSITPRHGSRAADSVAHRVSICRGV